jgi:glycosyltransferase involved in cell wall biosynthesis
MPPTHPLVSVCMVTYNHERFIAQAVDSVMAQRTDFSVELVVGEDCSTDGTRRILQELQARHGDRIRLLLNERNLGFPANLRRVWRACRGEYIAILEGDDYWTAAGKLQTQVDFMRSRPDCVMSFHDTRIVYEDGRREPHLFDTSTWKPIMRLADLFPRNTLPNCSVMYRRAVLPELPAWFEQLALCDWPTHLLFAQRGAIGYLPQLMAVYRKHPDAVWSLADTYSKAERGLVIQRVLNRKLGHRYWRTFGRNAAWLRYSMMELAVERGWVTRARRNAVLLLFTLPYHPGIRWGVVAAALSGPRLTDWWARLSRGDASLRLYERSQAARAQGHTWASGWLALRFFFTPPYHALASKRLMVRRLAGR